LAIPILNGSSKIHGEQVGDLVALGILVEMQLTIAALEVKYFYVENKQLIVL